MPESLLNNHGLPCGITCASKLQAQLCVSGRYSADAADGACPSSSALAPSRYAIITQELQHTGPRSGELTGKYWTMLMGSAKSANSDPAMMRPWMRVATPARIEKMVWLKM